MQRNVQTYDITASTILKFIGIVLALFLLWTVRGVVGIVIISAVFSSAIMPLVDRLHRYRIPRILAITLVYLLILGAIVLMVVLFGQLLTDQVRELSANLPSLYHRVVEFLFGDRVNDRALADALQNVLQSMTNWLSGLSSHILSGTVSLFGGLFSFVGILVLTFYIVLEKGGIKRFVGEILPTQYISYFHHLLDRIQDRLGGWVRGQLLLSLIIGGAVLLTLQILGVNYAFSLALIAALLEFIPFAGPILSGLIGTLVAFGQSPILALIVAIAYLLIQQAENYLIQPKLMAKSTGLNPVVVIVVAVVGATLAGFVGVILAIPLTLVVDTFIEDFSQEPGEPGKDAGADI